MLDRRKASCALGTFGIALALVAGTAAAQTSAPVRIGWVYAMANAPVLIADQQGLFEEQGVEVRIQKLGDQSWRVGTLKLAHTQKLDDVGMA